MPSDIELGPRITRADRGLTAGRELVALVTALSLGAYLAFSQELRFELANESYKRALVGQFAHERGLAGITLLHPVSAAGLATLGVFTLACALAGLLVRRALGASRGRTEAAVFAVAAATVPAMLLATALWPDGRGALRSGALIAGAVLVALVALVVARVRGDWPGTGPGQSRDSPGTVPGPSPAAVSAGSLAPGTPSLPATRDPGRGWAQVLLVALVPMVLGVWWNGIDAIRGFDSLSDHLPRAARWLALSRLSDESGTLLTPYYPGNFQLLVRWVLVAGTDAYAFLPSLVASVACLLAVYGICREIGQPRWTAAMSAATAGTCTLLPYLSTTVEADTAMTACLLVAVLMLLRWLRLTQAAGGTDETATDHLAPLAAMGASLGLAIGTKYSALPPALVLLVVVSFCALRRSHGLFPGGRRYLNARTFVVLMASVFVPLALCAGYWYLRNLVMHGNPFYPLATAGLPGVDMRYIIPIKPSLVNSAFARATYPWVQWDFVSVYDDGTGAAFAAVALVGFVVNAFRTPPPGSRRRLVWWITAAAYALWIGTGSITARFGLFPLLLTFVFVGELWREFETVALKVVTLTAALVTIALTTRSMIVGAVYTTVMPPGHRGVPAVIDSLPPSRIFNATAASNRYPLLGRDYRHEVITMFGPPTPRDLAAAHARYMLLSERQVPAFAAGATLVARGPATWGDTLSLWQLPPAGAR